MIIATPIWDQGRVARDPRLAFVIMPFMPKWSGYVYNELIKPAVSKAGLRPQRADEMTGRNVLQDIWRGIYASRLVIAEITEQNANVYYELGIAHTLGKKVILITQNIDLVPFDLRQQRIIVYTDDLPGYRKLESELPQHLAAILAEPVDEIHHIRSSVGGYLVELASITLRLSGNHFQSACVTDDMLVVGTRENGVLTNKVIDHGGVVTNMTCNHRFVRSTQYTEMVRVAALFEEPYLQVGSRERVTFQYDVEDGFVDDGKRWNYDVSVDTKRLEFELRAPSHFRARVRLAHYLKPTDHDLKVLTPAFDSGEVVYRGAIEDPDVGNTYALVWD